MKRASVLLAGLAVLGFLSLAADLTADDKAKAEDKDPIVLDAFARSKTQHVFYRSPDGDIMELYYATGGGWQRNNLTALAKAPKAAGNPSAYLLTYDRDSQHVIYRGTDGQLHELTAPTPDVKDGKWTHNNLTTPLKAPAAAGDPCSVVFDDKTQHIVYRSTDGDIVELNHTPKGERVGWHMSNLTAGTKAPRSAGNPCVFVFDKALHTVYRSTDGDVIELSFKPGDSREWKAYNLTATTKAPKAASDVCGYELTYGRNTQHVIYRGADGHIHELANPTPEGGWVHYDLTAATKAPAAVGQPCGFVFANTTQHIAFRTAEGDIVELNHAPKGDRVGWHVNNLTAETKAPAAGGEPAGYVFDKALHIVYPGKDGSIFELSYKPGTSARWQLNNLSKDAKGG
jgi:hypothetical protein